MIDQLAKDIGDSNEAHLLLTRRMHNHYHPNVAHTITIDDALLPTLIARAKALYPKRVATDFFGRTRTFKELDLSIRKTATILANHGISKGDVVSLIAPNCPQFVHVFYAAAHLGAIVALHNPLAPASQLTEQVRKTGAKLVVVWDKVWDSVAVDSVIKIALHLAADMPTKMHLALYLPITKARKTKNSITASVPKGTLYLHREVAKARPMAGEHVRCCADDPAALLHTGGTTGSPKAAILTHRNLMTNVEVAAQWVVNLREGAEVFYAALPFFHAFGLTLTMNAFIRMGATAVIFPKFDEQMLCKAMKRRPATFFLGVPAMFKRFVQEAKRTGTKLNTIGYSISGAMPLNIDIAEEWERATGGYLVEGYGMTETSPIVLGSPFSPERKPGTLGLVFPSIGVRVVDPKKPTDDVPLGDIGELIVKGPNCSPGYWNDPEQSAELYTCEGWLRTGDLVRADDDFLVMTDRRKELIITGGFNVYPSEVEAAIRTMSQIQEVAVVGIPEETGGEEVVAAIVLKPGFEIDLQAVREHAAHRISRYALPQHLVVLESMPYSQIGKVARKNVRDIVLKTIGTAKDK